MFSRSGEKGGADLLWNVTSFWKDHYWTALAYPPMARFSPWYHAHMLFLPPCVPPSSIIFARLCAGPHTPLQSVPINLNNKRPLALTLLREQKQPPERRVAFTPDQCALLIAKYPGLRIRIQPSDDRFFADEAYLTAGVEVEEEVLPDGLLMGIKERKPETLIEDRSYIFFSHTIKKQEYNRPLLQAVLDKRLELFDYEVITDDELARLVAFGHFAGVVGVLHALRMVGLRNKSFTMKAPRAYASLTAALADVAQIKLAGLRFAITGRGRVSRGAAQVLELAGIKHVSTADYLGRDFGAKPVYTMLSSQDLHTLKNKKGWISTEHFYHSPELYESRFAPYVAVTNVLITGAYWQEGYPKLFTLPSLANPANRLQIVADISCDINGAAPCTVRPSTIAEPYYDLSPYTGLEEEAFTDVKNISVMAVDNLPCEMPGEASKHFGEHLIEHFLPDYFTSGPVSNRAIMAKNGQLTQGFQYLEEWVGAVQ